MNRSVAVSEDAVSSFRDHIDSLYLVPCKWPEKLPETPTLPPKDTLYSHAEIMRLYRECYIRHNGLLLELDK